mmetsp:Transcript_9417/g.25069  ORF Transcript_9417/g.25069 Transcript_9417/m.25069 type:complete len:253 (-) Transcript_9417:321-1079(-)
MLALPRAVRRTPFTPAASVSAGADVLITENVLFAAAGATRACTATAAASSRATSPLSASRLLIVIARASRSGASFLSAPTFENGAPTSRPSRKIVNSTPLSATHRSSSTLASSAPKRFKIENGKRPRRVTPIDESATMRFTLPASIAAFTTLRAPSASTAVGPLPPRHALVGNAVVPVHSITTSAPASALRSAAPPSRVSATRTSSDSALSPKARRSSGSSCARALPSSRTTATTAGARFSDFADSSSCRIT